MKRAYVVAVHLFSRSVSLAVPYDHMIRWAGAARWRLWVVSLLAVYDFDRMRDLGWPWWTFEATDQVQLHLNSVRDPRVFEWGSGASTLWLAERATEVHAVEHDAGWADRVRQAAPGNVTVTTVTPVAVANGEPAVRSARAGNTGLDFKAYAEAITGVPGYFDLIVIDGRARESCLPLALERLAPGGLIVFDNVDRKRYIKAIQAVGARVDVTMTRGLTPALPYPTRTAIIAVAPGQ